MYLLFLTMASKVNGVYAASKLPWTPSNPHWRDGDIAHHPFDSRAADRSFAVGGRDFTYFRAFAAIQ